MVDAKEIANEIWNNKPDKILDVKKEIREILMRKGKIRFRKSRIATRGFAKIQRIFHYKIEKAKEKCITPRFTKSSTFIKFLA